MGERQRAPACLRAAPQALHGLGSDALAVILRAGRAGVRHRHVCRLAAGNLPAGLGLAAAVPGLSGFAVYGRYAEARTGFSLADCPADAGYRLCCAFAALSEL